VKKGDASGLRGRYIFAAGVHTPYLARVKVLKDYGYSVCYKILANASRVKIATVADYAVAAAPKST